MRSTLIRILVAVLLSLVVPASVHSAGKDPNLWQTATVLSAELNGHGAAYGANGKNAKQGDIWWTYCVSTLNVTYTAVLRESPTKTGMKPDAKIQVSVVKNRMYARNVAGKQYVLRVLRQTEGVSRN